MKNHPWIFVVLAFALVIGVWTTFIILANKNRPEQVPLEHLQKPTE